MAIFRPTMNSSASYFGICAIALNNFEDKSAEFDWADIFIDVTVNQEGSEYTRNIKIAGSLEKDAKGNITGGSVLKRMYTFFDAIGCKAGLTVKGKWEDDKGDAIENIAEYLNDKCVPALIPDDELVYPYLAYIYKEKPKKDGEKAWTRVYHKIYANNEANKTKLDSDVQWLKGRGVIKEVSDIPTPTNQNTLQGSGLASL